MGKSLWTWVLKTCKCAPAGEDTLILGAACPPLGDCGWNKQTEPLDLRYFRTKKYPLAKSEPTEMVLWRM